MVQSLIQIRGARQNNLAAVDVDIPRNRLVAITGVSGSGKSSLAFDTLFREGQRRFLETLSAYARQFLGHMEKPEVESVTGLSPAIAVDQKSIPKGTRSTVGTLTEIVDHLRVLYARAGRPHCASCRLPVRSQTPEEIVQQVLRESSGETVLVLAPLVRDRKGHHKSLLDDLRKKGFVRARVDGTVQRIEEVPELARYQRHTIEVVVDRIQPAPTELTRLREAVEQALEVGGGDLVTSSPAGDKSYSTSRSCPGCGADVPPLEPRLFSFNSPHGACPDCQGLGVVARASEASLVRDASLSIRDGALAVTRASGGGLAFPRVDFAFLEQVGAAHDFDLDTPWRALPPRAKKILLHGTGEERFDAEAHWSGKKFKGSVKWQRRYPGVLPAIETASKQGGKRRFVERYLAATTCAACGGSRLKPAANAVLLGGLPFADVTRAPISELWPKLSGLVLTPREARIARDLFAEVRRRADFLLEVGLGYLTLDRSADTLSGGEAQRIRLAAQLGAGLRGVLYVLDEPSIGLHARDQGRLLTALRRLRDAGNTVVVVEHDEATLRSADWLIDVGPGAGRHGGHVTAIGAPADVARTDTPTGRLLRGEWRLAAPPERRSGNGHELVVEGARAFHLKDVDVRFPLGTFTAVSGVSGSGKSTLVERILARAVARHLGREAPPPEEHGAVRGLKHVDDLVEIDATPIGRTPRSNPATYTGVFDPIRDLFASLPESRMRGYGKSRFSFNVAGGRCEACGGAGARYIELQFLAPVTVTCEECGGHRFQAQTLEVHYREKHIADVLALTVEEALELFKDHPKIARPLSILEEVGLGYLTLGQPSTTLSGGEAQRLKLATELSRSPRGHTLYLLDEPTTGLHMQDVARLVAALQRLVDLGHTVLVIEHNLDVLRAADWIVDLGPDGGEHGGELVAAGTPEAVAKTKRSFTGQALRGEFDVQATAAVAPVDGADADATIRVQGARTHNLKNVDVAIPREALTVVTGPSGSGKSSLALDTIFTEGRRRFVESLSTYARQFLGTKDRPPVDKIDGLGPAVAVEARVGAASPRSTVATTTEIHDHLRVLWARAATRRCPLHGEKLEPADASHIARRIAADLAGTSGWIVAPVFGPGLDRPSDLAAAWRERSEAWRAAGFTRFLVDGAEQRLDAPGKEIGADARVDLVLDRVTFGDESRSRIAEAVEAAQAVSGGRVSALARTKTADASARREYSTAGACTQCGFAVAEALEPRHFSFNTHVGACPDCDGLGERAQCDAELLFKHPERSVLDGALDGKLSRYLVKGKGYYEMLLRSVAKAHKVDLRAPWSELSTEARALIAHGVGARESYRVRQERTTEHAQIEEEFVSSWPGLCGHVDAWHAKTEDPEWAGILERVMTRRTCAACQGERLAPAARAATLGKKRLPELLRTSVAEALEWAEALSGRSARVRAVAPVLEEVRTRLALLARVGLGYLTLDRSTSTLSGGEARRVRLSASLGSRLVGVCYVLDEPTVGLHPRDVDALTDALTDLSRQGNTVIVVEHDLHLMQRADWLVDVGPGAGRHGGQIVAAGKPADVARHATSTTARALRGELAPLREASRSGEAIRGGQAGDASLARKDDGVVLRGAKHNNLKDVELAFAFGRITGVCGPSGSGKSTLVLDTLVPALRGESPDGRWKSLTGPLGGGVRVVVADAAPIGRTPASVPATYTGLMDPLRELYARTPEARLRGFDAGRFSFNGTKGRCPACEGRGATQVEMQFLADLWLTCEECDGTRYAPEVLEVRFRNLTIAQALELTAEEAREFFEHQPKIASIATTLCDVGLGYLQLGQSSTTLSGGEAQRLKLASELFQVGSHGKTVIVLDEPTTGLSLSDVGYLVRVLDRLAASGAAVVVIEHHTALLAVCDELVELGPAGGKAGGRVIARGTPAELARDAQSITGPWIAPELARARAAGEANGPPPRRRVAGRSRA